MNYKEWEDRCWWSDLRSCPSICLEWLRTIKQILVVCVPILGALVAVSWLMCLVNQWPFSMRAQVHSQTNQYGICDRQISAGTGFAQSPYTFPCWQYSSNVPYSFYCDELYNAMWWSQHWTSCKYICCDMALFCSRHLNSCLLQITVGI